MFLNTDPEGLYVEHGGVLIRGRAQREDLPLERGERSLPAEKSLRRTRSSRHEQPATIILS
jgi:hypothetical protein